MQIVNRRAWRNQCIHFKSPTSRPITESLRATLPRSQTLVESFRKRVKRDPDLFHQLKDHMQCKKGVENFEKVGEKLMAVLKTLATNAKHGEKVSKKIAISFMAIFLVSCVN